MVDAARPRADLRRRRARARTPDAPTVVLLHALGCTAYLCWFGASPSCRGPTASSPSTSAGTAAASGPPRFRFVDCADDAAAVLDALGIDQALVVGYSMGGAVAQELWHRHPERVTGLVLASTARNFRGHTREKLFFPLMTLAMNPLSRVAQPKVERLALGAARRLAVRRPRPGRLGRARVPQHQRLVDARGARRARPVQLRALDRRASTCPPRSSSPRRDKAIPARRQRALAAAIPGAEVLEAPGGHASVVMDHAGWFPVFLEAVAGRDRPGRPRAAQVGRGSRAAARSSGPRRRG